MKARGYEDYFSMKINVIKSILEKLRKQKGTCTTIRAIEIVKQMRMKNTPINVTLIAHILEKLEKKELISLWNISSHGKKFIINRDSELWKLLDMREEEREKAIKRIAEAIK